MAVVSNSSPLIAFAAIEQLNLLATVFSSVVIPPAVALEIAPSISPAPSWLRVESLRRPLPPSVLRRSLGDGERESLALAIEIDAERMLLDDRPARRIAMELNLLVTGTAGVPLVAKRRGLVPRIRPHLDALIQKSFFIGSELYDELLRLAGEYET